MVGNSLAFLIFQGGMNNNMGMNSNMNMGMNPNLSNQIPE